MLKKKSTVNTTTHYYRLINFFNLVFEVEFTFKTLVKFPASDFSI